MSKLLFMSKIKDIMGEAVLSLIKTIGKEEMEDVFSCMKKNATQENYKTTLQGLYSELSLLKEAALKTKAKIGDGIIDFVLETIKQNADSDGIVLYR